MSENSRRCSYPRRYNNPLSTCAESVDLVSHPDNGEEGCVLEVFNAVGESLTVIAVPMSSVEALRPDAILTIRSFPKAG